MGGSAATRRQEGVKSAQNKWHGQMREMDIQSLMRELSCGSGARCGSHGTDPGIEWGAVLQRTLQYDTCRPAVNEEQVGVSFISEQRFEQCIITYTELRNKKDNFIGKK